MEVMIRLQKAGKIAKKHSNYRIVAVSKADSRETKSLDILGYYDPARKPAAVSINHEKLDKWLKNGAQLSDTVKSLVKTTKRSNGTP